MNIKSKLLLSSFVLIVLTIILGLVSYKSVEKLTHKLIPTIQVNDHVSTEMLQLRRNEKDFLARALYDPNFFQTGKNKYLSKFDENFADLQENFETLKSYSHNSTYLERINEMQRLSEEYKKGFLKVVEMKRKRGFKDWGAIGELRSAVHIVEDKLELLGDQAETESLKVSMLMLRRHEKDYLLRNDVSYQNKLILEADNFSRKLQALEISLSDSTRMDNLIKSYKAKFDNVVQIDSQIGRDSDEGLMGDYRQTIHQLEPIAKVQMDYLNNEANKVSNDAISLILGSIFVILLAGVGSAIYLAGKITKPLKLMTEAGKKVASGDLSVTIPAVTSKDEVKDMSDTMNALIGALKYHLKKNA